MTDRIVIRKALEREVAKLVRRYNKSAAVAKNNQLRYEKRSGDRGALAKRGYPAHWGAHAHFNPFYVRSRLDSFAHAISRGLKNQNYEPNPSLTMQIPKPGGGTRGISVSTVPDAALAYWLGHRLIDRNSYRFSSYTYAYRRDRNAHHAIENLMVEIRDSSRLFVLEYDFSSYFDSIDHDYLEFVLRKYFLVSPLEHALLKSALTNQRADSIQNYMNGVFEKPSAGIPQGSSISLFLANVACYELDREIEQIGVTFARYADDTLILCDSYEKADSCAKLLLEHGNRSGTRINFNKSPGISLLTPDKNAEFRHTESVSYLSHTLSPGGVAIAPKAIMRIKKRVARIIYKQPASTT